jgi:hypothetical protein
MGEAVTDLRAVHLFLRPFQVEKNGSAIRRVGSADKRGHDDHIEAGEMAVERARDIERGLKARFLSSVIVDQQEDIFHSHLHRTAVDPLVQEPDACRN